MCSFSKVCLLAYLVSLGIHVCACWWRPEDNFQLSFSPPPLCRGRIFLLPCFFHAVYPRVVGQEASRQFPCLFLLSHQGLLGMQMHATSFGFSCGFQRLTPSHQACMGRAFPTVYPISPHWFFIKLHICKRSKLVEKKSMLAGENKGSRCH